MLLFLCTIHGATISNILFENSDGVNVFHDFNIFIYFCKFTNFKLLFIFFLTKRFGTFFFELLCR